MPEGTSVMRAAMLAGIKVPKLCATNSLTAFGSCRLCLVEIEGRTGTPASCTTPVAPGMKVSTVTDRVRRIRRGVMELYLSDHPRDGFTSPVAGNSEFQEAAGLVGVREVRYGYAGDNHLDAPIDASNPYFQFDPARCIVCSRCVRACEETQGTFALTVEGRGFASKIVAGMNEPFLTSECVSCGACVQACPTGSLIEKSVVELGQPEHSVMTTCAYCGVGCNFKAEMQGDVVVRMVPDKDGKANHGHSCIKGRFAWGYATHPDRILKPMMRNRITEPWREVSWDTAIARVADEFRRIQETHGRGTVGAITSSRCTDEETYLMQKLVRSGFLNNNIDTCARVCHSPTGYGLKTTFGTSAGTNDFDSVDQADVIMVMGANPTDGHPVFASRLKRRLREGAKLIVIDPRRIDLVRTPHVEAPYHLPIRPAPTSPCWTRWPRHRHRGPGRSGVCRANAASWMRSMTGRRSCGTAQQPRGSGEAQRRCAATDPGGGAALCRRRRIAAIYYGLGVTEHSQGSTAVMALAKLAMATGNVGLRGSGVNPLRGQNNVQGSCDMGSFPHELPDYRHVSDPTARRSTSANGASRWTRSRGCASPTCWTRRRTARSGRCISRARTSCSPIRTRSTSPPGWRRWSAWSCRTCS